MPTLTLIPLLAPLALLAGALASLAVRGPAALRGLRAAALTAVAAALTSLALVAATGAADGYLFRLDPVSAALLALVTGLGAVILPFSIRYLDGDPRRHVFLARLALTLAMVTTLVIAGNLVLMALAWIGMSLALHGLLTFRRERPAARLAARHKFILARLSDAALVVAVALLTAHFGTAHVATISDAIRQGADVPTAAPLLLALAAILKSALLPVHGWLTRVIDAPTPVSALLHAGLVNAGGAMLIRLSDILSAAPAAMTLLAVTGAASAIVAGLVALTQCSAKQALAWSTIAQMGFMLMQCGLGLWALALLHIVAHSIYKAHAFLRAGSAVETIRAIRPGAPRATLPTALAALALSTALVAAIGAAFGLNPASDPQVLALGAVLGAGLLPLLAPALAAPRLAPRGLGTAALVTAGYFAVHAAAGSFFAGLPQPPALSPAALTALALGTAAFAAAGLVQTLAPGRTGAGWAALRLHLARGLYLDTLLTRALPAPKA
ncbi:oxidoreductase [Halovulum dunhuangense]|uniref:Probable inorganic carbon transporter subunit DabB n=1 Tax=Halovulum dunhuangense TaxID=1505036 RepID=A0A849KRF3_9RHOB|nr:proton-conducting transporter membrane subunit [Halovulum dunhuangense]NNU79439.1 oxidoreductase [Halovulum dunhuangense]